MAATVKSVLLSLTVAIAFCTGCLWLWSSDQVRSGWVTTTAQIPVLLPLSATIISPETNLSIAARPAAFGPPLPVRRGEEDNDENSTVGLSGRIHVVRSLACNLDSDYEDLTNKVALVFRGGCGFYEKVLILQEWGAKGVIVGDSARHRGLVTMFTKDELDLAQIPSVFVSFDSYHVLKSMRTITMYSGSESSPIADTMIFLLVSPLCSLSLIYGLLLFHRRYKILKERAPKSFVEGLPTRVWAKRNAVSEEQINRPPFVWVSSGECIICLEDYVPGVSRVMRLPCDHEFHAECISKWLISRRKTCPICKQNVMDAETTPLISRGSPASDDHTSPLL